MESDEEKTQEQFMIGVAGETSLQINEVVS
jgi:hypothetical protein